MTALEAFRKECTGFFESISEDGYRPLVFGEGNADSPVLMLIGEAPGEQEALKLRPFVGKAGKNLDQFLQTLELRREEIYISNVVKIRPSKISPAGRIVNRPPTREEKALFTPWLMKEIALVRPRAIVTLGNVALQAFVDDVIGNRHGRYHPASVIYNHSLKTVYAQDLQTLKTTFRSPDCIL